MIPFNKPPFLGTEMDYVRQAVVDNNKICGDGPFTFLCQEWLENRFDTPKTLLTTSGTSALEMAALLCELKPGDEVILPSYTFTTTATSFARVGAKLVFVDIRPDTKNIDETKIEDAITDKTRVIVPVHYAGVACEMDAIMDIARRHNLLVVEDAAQGVMSYYKGKALGTIGDLGCYSFHETKNYSMGEGGAICVKDPVHQKRAEIIREKGTNRASFFRGQVDKYTWVDVGSSYLPSDINAAYLLAQLEQADRINNKRLDLWSKYYQAFQPLQGEGLVELPFIPENCTHNAHMFYLVMPSLEERTTFISRLRDKNIHPCFHYIPLHSSPEGSKVGRFHGVDEHTTDIADRLVRLPLYYAMTEEEQGSVIESVLSFFR